MRVAAPCGHHRVCELATPLLDTSTTALRVQGHLAGLSRRLACLAVTASQLANLKMATTAAEIAAQLRETGDLTDGLSDEDIANIIFFHFRYAGRRCAGPSRESRSSSPSTRCPWATGRTHNTDELGLEDRKHGHGLAVGVELSQSVAADVAGSLHAAVDVVLRADMPMFSDPRTRAENLGISIVATVVANAARPWLPTT